MTQTQILIVEDDPHSARVLRCLLRSGGFDQVITSLDGDDILRRCQSGAVDLALLDVSLTGCKLGGKPIDGVALCQRIKQSPGDRPVPVILVTANAMRGDAERLLHESGADDYVSKPIQDHDGLLHLVAVHLATAQAVARDELLPCGDDGNLPALRSSLEPCSTKRQSEIMPKRQTILIAEDDPAVRRILQKTLASCGAGVPPANVAGELAGGTPAPQLLGRPEYEVLTACDGEEALRLFLKHTPALVVTDWMMPKIDGPDLCRAIRCDADAGYTYVLLLTTKSERADVVRGLEAGADDYVTKPFDGDELLARIRAGLRIVELEQTLRQRQRELEEANHRLAELAVTDPLTGLYNRRRFEELLDRDLAAAVSGRRPLSVALIDVDKFKSINDRLGHATGDLVLRHVAQKLAEIPSSVAARIGGDEFALLFPGVELDEVERTCGALSDELRGRPIDGPFGSIPLGISIGVAGVPPLVGNSVAELLAAADAAMYRAKALSRSRVNGVSGKPHHIALGFSLLGN